MPLPDAITRSFPCLLLLPLALAGCGSGGSSNSGGGGPPPPPPPPATFDTQHLVSAASPFADGCEGVNQNGTLYSNAEVEPQVSANPLDSRNLVGSWQQDRWSNGGSRGLQTGASFDGGVTWTRTTLPVSRCGGGNAGNGGDYLRATDPWVSFSPNGVVYQFSLGISGGALQPGSISAMLVLRSTDGGRTWSAPITLILDGDTFFNDKNAITADPTNSNFVYAVWDRLAATGGGPAMMARTSNGGSSWEAAHAIYDPGLNSQTLGNIIAVLPNGTVINLFNQIDTAGNGSLSSHVKIIRSTDHGGSWSAPIQIADLLAVGTRDPDSAAVVRDGASLPEIAVAPSGRLYVVWQDARFSGGARDGIAISRSDDGGLSWSPPAQLNALPAVPAFTPIVHVRADGVVGVSYFDFSSNTSASATLFTDYWLARSVDGISWGERRVAGPFDLKTAPTAEGLFLGDYQGLTSNGTTFVPFFVQTNSGNLANRTDVFAAPQTTPVTTAAIAAVKPAVARTTAIVAPAAPLAISPEFRQKVHENLVRVLERRAPGWYALQLHRRGITPPPSSH